MPQKITINGSGKLFLIPNIIHPKTEHLVIAPIIFTVIRETKFYLVENIRTARRYLSSLMKLLPEIERTPIVELEFEVLDENTSSEEVHLILESVRAGRNCGIISESGCPGIADPGSEAVKAAHRMKIEVVPLPGPSSIFMALMASGLNGQAFTFHGYLPVDKQKLAAKIKQLENDARTFSRTQIFIETPYRNQRIYDTLISTCSQDIKLCVAMDITGADAFINTMTIQEWSQRKLSFEKTPAVYLLF